MILECLKDCYMKDEDGNLTDNRCFTKGKIYEVEFYDIEAKMYRLIDNNKRTHFISSLDKNFREYIYNLYVIDVQGKGKLLLRARAHTEALKKASSFIGNNIDFSIARIDFQMDDEGRTVRYEL